MPAECQCDNCLSPPGPDPRFPPTETLETLRRKLDRQTKISEAYKAASRDLATWRSTELRVWQKAYLLVADQALPDRAVAEEMLELSKRNGVLTLRLNRALELYTSRCEATVTDYTDAEELFLADLSEILRGETDEALGG